MKLRTTRFLFSALLLLLASATLLNAQHKQVDPRIQEITPLAVENYPCPGTATFTEDFESGLPAGWTILDLDGATPRPQLGLNPGWQLIQDYKDTSNTAIASPSWYTLPDSSDDWLIMSALTVGNNTCFSWRAYSADPFFRESYELRISTTTADTAGFFAEPALKTVTGESGEETYQSANLSDYAGQTVFLAFRQTSFNHFILVLDDLKTTEYSTTLDAGVDSISTIDAIATVAFQFSGAVRNYGTDTITAFDINYSLDGGTVLTESFDSIILPPNFGFFFLHDSLYTAATAGSHSICFWSNNANLQATDDDISNDTLCVNFTVAPFVGIESLQDIEQYFRVWPNPFSSHISIDTRLPNPAQWELTLMSLEGKLISQMHMDASGSARLDLNTIPQGMYLLKIQGEAGHFYRKVVKH